MPSGAASPWKLAEPDLATVFAEHEQPLEELATGAIPAIVLRGVFPPEACQRLVDRLIDEQLLYDPRGPIPEAMRDAAIPEGYYREGRNREASRAWQAKTAEGRTRIDIGTSLGYRGSDQQAFFAHSEQTHALFARLLDDSNENPIRLLYDRLSQLGRGKRAVTAHEPDGRRYGPAIIRAHYGGYTYKPHFDSVRLREKREDYVVHQFEHQFAGVLVLQNSQLADKTAQCILHRRLWEPEIEPHLQRDTFHEYARQHGVENLEVHLEPGDLYFFNTRSIHEVPGLAGESPRIVLATFIGYSRDRDEMFVWS
ncbi:MAG: hypothetical protein RIC55_05865 [Pirellulaceae bacterium]